MEITIDGKEINNEIDFHKEISKKLGFPSYYGENLDALWDVLSTDIERPVTLKWVNSKISNEKMGEDFKKIKSVLDKVTEQDKKWGLEDKFIVIYD